ncbi:thioredoxin-like protein [Ilyonectria robusta]|uniref:thioredoxin-like protein n=1 Tax=Ilyonectria robusta TaxID=1079257 RepID=UPI001E8D0E44|nr:thioredoxin-like protein [Ilyonectria robusta]KAH8736881.1 thioredoxin-like protein [Ilyonectria robusta]
MPSPRRVRLLMLATFLTFVFILFYTSGFDSGHDAELQNPHGFIQKTKDAMHGGSRAGEAVLDSQTGQKAGHIPADKDADGDVDDDDRQMAAQMQERLKAAEVQAKEKANQKGGLRPDAPGQVVGVGSSADGQKDGQTEKTDKTEKSESGSGSGSGNSDAAKSGEKETEASKEVREAQSELTSILAKAPVIIFSKSYCPFSKRAKGILLEKYSISPEPYVVELDKHPLMTALQDQLAKSTGRRTVPNIMINGVSIGGADDIVALDNDDKLVAKILERGNDKVQVSERFVKGGSIN